jgi:hypothetical protein
MKSESAATRQEESGYLLRVSGIRRSYRRQISHRSPIGSRAIAVAWRDHCVLPNVDGRGVIARRFKDIAGAILADHAGFNAPRLVSQFASLERSVSKSGKELIGPPPNVHDDVANAAACRSRARRGSGAARLAHPWHATCREEEQDYGGGEPRHVRHYSLAADVDLTVLGPLDAPETEPSLFCKSVRKYS